MLNPPPYSTGPNGETYYHPPQDPACPWCGWPVRVADGERWKCAGCGETLGIQPRKMVDGMEVS